MPVNSRGRGIAVTLMLALLIGCSGGGSTPSVGAQQPIPQASAPAQKAPQSVSVSFNIVVPTASGAKARRVPNYVSTATQSASITVAPSGGSAGTPTVVNCTAACSGTISAPVGSDTFAMNLYDTTNGGGNVLSTGTLTQVIVAGTANSVNVTFNGVVASLAISLGASGTAGTAATIPVTLNAFDADGKTIVGPGVYVNASDTPLTVTLGDSDATGATILSQTTATQPTSGITMSYTGLAIAPASIGASATGITTNSTTFTPTLQPIVYSGPLNGSNPNIQFGITSGSFSASEVGWTNAPYTKNLTATAASNCSTIGSVSPGSGTSFTATIAGSPTIGNCAVALGDNAGQTLGVTLTTPAIGTPAALGSNQANGAAPTSIGVTTTQAAPAGSAIIVISTASALFGPQATGVTCADSAGNTYHTDVSESLGVNDLTAICSAPALANQLPSGGTITVSWTGTAPNGQIYLASAWSVTGLASSPLDQTAFAAGTGSSASSGTTATTAQANELLFGAIEDTGSGVSGAGFTPGSNGTSSTCATTGSPTYSGLGGIDSGNPPSLFGMYCVVNGTGGYAANATLTGNPFWQAMLATYKGVTP